MGAASLALAAAGPSGRSGGFRARPLRAAGVAERGVHRVLLLEPNAASRALLQLGLSRAGFEVRAVEEASAAWAELSDPGALPSLVVAAAGPGADGFSFCGALRAEARTAHLPVLLLTHASELFDEEMANGVGADDCLRRPVFVEDVVALALLRAGRSSVERHFEARCEEIPLARLTRALLSGMRSGRVELARRVGSFSFKKGKLISACFEGVEGRPGLERLLLLAEGGYSATFGPGLGEGPLCVSQRELCEGLLPAHRQGVRALALAPPLTARLALDFRGLARASAQLPVGIEQLARLADGRRTVRQVVLDSPLSPALTLQALTRLQALGVVTVVPAGPTLRAVKVDLRDAAVALSTSQPAALAGLKRALTLAPLGPLADETRATLDALLGPDGG